MALPETVSVAQQAAEQVSFWVQYANVLIPLVVSIATGIAAFLIYREKVKNLGEDMKEVKKELKELRDMCIECKTTLKEREPLTKKESPVSLTDRGRNVLTASGGLKFIEDHFDELFNKIEERTPKTAYDIQELAKKVVYEISSDDRFIPLKDYLYKEGESLDELVTVMGVELRDKALAKKQWNVSDVDKYDPQRSTPISNGS